MEDEMAIIPSVRGLILCESAEVDPVTKNLSMLQCFRAFRADRFPAATRKFFALAHHVNGWGEVLLRLEIVRLSDDRSIYRYANRVRFLDRMREIRLKVEIGQFIAPSDGKYGIELWADAELIAQSDFSVIGAVT
jgi:hypothetical protein